MGSVNVIDKLSPQASLVPIIHRKLFVVAFRWKHIECCHYVRVYVRTLFITECDAFIASGVTYGKRIYEPDKALAVKVYLHVSLCMIVAFFFRINALCKVE